jgi:hypothetical protein
MRWQMEETETPRRMKDGGDVGCLGGGFRVAAQVWQGSDYSATLFRIGCGGPRQHCSANLAVHAGYTMYKVVSVAIACSSCVLRLERMSCNV